MITQNPTSPIENEDVDDFFATLDALVFMAGLENADPAWVKETGITVDHLLAIKAEGLITNEFDVWYPYLQDHLWGVRRNVLDFLIRYAPKEVRLTMVTSNGEHTFAGHLPDLIFNISKQVIGMKVISSGGLGIYIADLPVTPAARNFQVDVWLRDAKEYFDANPCSLHKSRR